MRRHVIVGRLGASDNSSVAAAQDELITELQMLHTETQLAYGLSDTVRELLKSRIYPSALGADLLMTAALVYAADTRISRSTESQDTWTREIRLVVPVMAIEKWLSVQELLADTLGFLTGDRWTLDFRPATHLPRIISERPPSVEPPSRSVVSLFSGGLDSLIGAIDLLHGGETSIFVSHAGDGATSAAQQLCFEALQAQYGESTERFRFWLAFPRELVDGTLPEDTTRARSFLFFALAARGESAA